MFNSQRFLENLTNQTRLVHDLSSMQRFEVQMRLEQYEQLILMLLQECDRLQFQKTTKFLAKCYFDIALTNITQIDFAKSIIYLFTSIRLAVKFNENRSLSEKLTIQTMIDQTQFELQHQYFILAELQILKALKYKLHFITPYNILDIFRPFLCSFQRGQQRVNKLQTLIDYAITLPQLMLISSSQIFLACLSKCFDVNYNQDSMLQAAKILKANGETINFIRQVISRSLNEVPDMIDNQQQ